VNKVATAGDAALKPDVFAVKTGGTTTQAQLAQFLATCPPSFEITYFDHFPPCSVTLARVYGWKKRWPAVFCVSWPIMGD
jgi:hypothetical protein